MTDSNDTRAGWLNGCEQRQRDEHGFLGPDVGRLVALVRQVGEALIVCEHEIEEEWGEVTDETLLAALAAYRAAIGD